LLPFDQAKGRIQKKRKLKSQARGQKHRFALFIHLVIIFKGVDELPSVGIASF